MMMMSDPRTEYEAMLDTAIAVLGDDCKKAYGAFEQTAERAWYDYRIRTGMIPVPDAAEAESETHDDENGSSGPAGPGDDSGDDGPADTVGSAHSGEDDPGGRAERGPDGGIAAPAG